MHAIPVGVRNMTTRVTDAAKALEPIASAATKLSCALLITSVAPPAVDDLVVGIPQVNMHIQKPDVMMRSTFCRHNAR